MTNWTQVEDGLPDDQVVVWVSDNKSVGLSEYSHELGDWLYCDQVVGEITCWLPIEYPETPKP